MSGEKFGVVIVALFPPILAAVCTSRKAAQATADHIQRMFPHLAGDVQAVAHDDWYFSESVPATGFVRDCVHAYIATGNGDDRPAPGTVTQ